MNLNRTLSPEQVPEGEPGLECFEVVSFMDFPNDAASSKNDPLCGSHSFKRLETGT